MKKKEGLSVSPSASLSAEATLLIFAFFFLSEQIILIRDREEVGETEEGDR